MFCCVVLDQKESPVDACANPNPSNPEQSEPHLILEERTIGRGSDDE